jgi:hypothetical protein
MNEYLLVEFVAKDADRPFLISKLLALGDDFSMTKMEDEFETLDGSLSGQWYRVEGKISSQRASIIKLQDKFLAERMKVSYISDELKDKYRR